MRSFGLIALLLWSTGVLAQRNAVFFSEQGEKMLVFVDGEQINTEAAARVKASSLTADQYRVRVQFPNQNIPELNTRIYFMEPSEERTFVIKRGPKGYVCRFQSTAPVSNTAVQPGSGSNQGSVATTDVAPGSNGKTRKTKVTTDEVTTSTTTTTTQNQMPADNGSIPDFNMNVQVNGQSAGITVNTNKPGSGKNKNSSDNGISIQTTIPGSSSGTVTSSSSYTTTTTTTTQSGGSKPPKVRTTPAEVSPNDATPAGYDGPTGCNGYPMSKQSFENAKKSISSKTFEDTRLTVAKQAFSSVCLSSAQVKEIMRLFTFESNRLTFAKYAYSRTYDIGNYYMINDVFTFEGSIDELNQFIQSGGNDQ